MTAPHIAPLLAGKTVGSVNDDFIIAEWQDAGGESAQPRLIAPLHVHHRDDEAWYVLQGVLRVRAGNEEIEAHAGSSVFVRRGTPHTYWNPGPGQLRYLLVMTPKIFGLITAIHAMRERTPAALRQVFRQFDSDLLDS